jgi:hypothetical protein
VRAKPVSVTGLTIASIAVAVLIFVAESYFKSVHGGSLLLNLTFWLALAEGSVALMAAAEVSRATWHYPIKEHMLSAYPMILVIAALFLSFIPQMDIYPWWGEPHFWAQKWLFVTRHTVWMLATFLVARKFAAEALKGTHQSRRWGVVYLLLFALGQTIVGLEWVMSLEKPWFSTLFGGYFIVEAFQSGIAVAGIVLLAVRAPADERWRIAQRSVGLLLFGFSIFWVYFYFSQLIVIWYGNLPEEVQYLARRIGYHTPYWALARGIFGLCWVVPFVVLMGKRPKMNPFIVATMAVLILLGYYLEKWLMIAPATPVVLWLQIAESVALGGLFFLFMVSGSSTLPSVERAASPAPAPSPQEIR